MDVWVGGWIHDEWVNVWQDHRVSRCVLDARWEGGWMLNGCKVRERAPRNIFVPCTAENLKD